MGQSIKRDNSCPVTQDDILTWQSRLRSVVLDSIGEGDIRDILEAVVAKAKKGDLQAARLVLSYAVGSPSADSCQGLPAPVVAPTSARNGSREKLDVLAMRRARGLPLHANGDSEVDLS